jgi:hypothetical protein
MRRIFFETLVFPGQAQRKTQNWRSAAAAFPNSFCLHSVQLAIPLPFRYDLKICPGETLGRHNHHGF